MDRECVLLLPRVCEVLADSDSSLPDDTSLEKLLDWLTGFTEAGGSLPETCPCLLQLISAVIYNPGSDPSVLSFTLKLTGLMASSEDGFKTLQDCATLELIFNTQQWKKAGLWEDPCIRISWIGGLKRMLQHPKALSFFVQSDFIKPLLQLQTDSSLFVASAANQILSHILLFFQPVSASCARLEDKDKISERTNVSIKPPALITETCTGYTSVVMAIFEHIKKSLVPREDAHLHQTVQILKLLALLLAQAAPPLRDELLHTVAGSLEELVMAGYSQLTPAVMDAVMAAYSSDDRVPHQSLSRLLSSMLSINNPADLVHAAATFLHRGARDPVNTARAVRILLLPLAIVAEPGLLGPAADEHQTLVAAQLRSKTSCIYMICVCLRNTSQITLMTPDVLPCPPGLIVLAVVSLLRICSGDISSSSSGCREVFRNIIGSGKVQKCALEALTSLSSSPGARDTVREALTLLMEYLRSPDSDPTVLHKCYKALVKWMSVCTVPSSSPDQFSPDLVKLVRKRVCDPRWEVRDSTVEFLGQLAAVFPSLKSADEAFEALLGDCGTIPLLREALQDSESYVRASATSALAQTLASSWQQGAVLPQEQIEIVSRLLEILSEDTEGFARRAVIRYFIAWFSSSSSSSPSSASSSSSSLLRSSVCTVLSHGSADLDWEVKVHTLELAELLLDEVLSGHPGYRKCSDPDPALQHPYAVVPGQAHTLHTHAEGQTHVEGVKSDVVDSLKQLVKQGVFPALLSGLVDCDRPVALKACQLLITLRETVHPLLVGSLTAAAATATCELPERGWGREVRKILATKRCNHTDEADCVTQADEEECDGVCVSVYEVLSSLGLDEQLNVLTQSSDHVHNSLLSLLQDILSAGDTHGGSDTQQEQEVIVDCY